MITIGSARISVPCWHAKTTGRYAASEGADGERAIAKVLELAPHVVIMDPSMPVMNGLQAAKRIRRLAPSTKIILFSIHDAPMSARDSVADALVSKASGRKELIPTIERLTG